jgi:hypothetical protein
MDALRIPLAWGSISTKDTYIITPAENPRTPDNSLVFVRFVKNAIRLPIPVDNPAIRVSPKAISTSLLFIYYSSPAKKQ